MLPGSGVFPRLNLLQVAPFVRLPLAEAQKIGGLLTVPPSLWLSDQGSLVAESRPTGGSGLDDISQMWLVVTKTVFWTRVTLSSSSWFLAKTERSLAKAPLSIFITR